MKTKAAATMNHEPAWGRPLAEQNPPSSPSAEAAAVAAGTEGAEVSPGAAFRPPVEPLP